MNYQIEMLRAWLHGASQRSCNHAAHEIEEKAFIAGYNYAKRNNKLPYQL